MNRFSQMFLDEAKSQAAEVLLESSINFLCRNSISNAMILDCVTRHFKRKQARGRKKQFQMVTRAYEEMGTVLSTWFDCPRFLTADGNPAPVSTRRGDVSLKSLLTTAKVGISPRDALDLFRRSPSVRINSDGSISAVRRVFVLGEFDLCRAALIVPRYIDTLSSNSNAYKTGTVKLLERQCSVSQIELSGISPILRSIKEQGASFVDSIDGQIERRKKSAGKRHAKSELGLLVFSWTNTKVLERKRLRKRSASGIASRKRRISV